VTQLIKTGEPVRPKLKFEYVLLTGVNYTAADARPW